MANLIRKVIKSDMVEGFYDDGVNLTALISATLPESTDVIICPDWYSNEEVRLEQNSDSPEQFTVLYDTCENHQTLIDAADAALVTKRTEYDTPTPSGTD